MLNYFRQTKHYGSGSYQLYEPGEPINLNKRKFKFKKSMLPLLAAIFWIVRLMIGV